MTTTSSVQHILNASLNVNHQPVVLILASARHGIHSRWGMAVRNNGMNYVTVSALTARDDLSQIMDHVHGILLPGGDTNVQQSLYDGEHSSAQPNEPELDEAGAYLIHEYTLGRQIPTLAVCRGFQLANVVLGGSLQPLDHDLHYTDARDYESVARERHVIKIEKGGLLHQWNKWLDFADVNSIHTEGIDRLADDFAAQAICDEDGLVEAATFKGHPYFFGSQFHAELPSKSGINEAIFQRYARAVYGFSGHEYSTDMADDRAVVANNPALSWR